MIGHRVGTSASKKEYFDPNQARDDGGRWTNMGTRTKDMGWSEQGPWTISREINVKRPAVQNRSVKTAHKIARTIVSSTSLIKKSRGKLTYNRQDAANAIRDSRLYARAKAGDRLPSIKRMQSLTGGSSNSWALPVNGGGKYKVGTRQPKDIISSRQAKNGRIAEAKQRHAEDQHRRMVPGLPTNRARGY